jgi:hypothetical protein
MLSSGFAAASVGSCVVSGCAVWPAEAVSALRAVASSDADDSGTGDCTGVLAATSLTAEVEGRGAAGGTGSLARGALTEVSPVNGFLYSVCGVMTSSAVGL